MTDTIGLMEYTCKECGKSRPPGRRRCQDCINAAKRIGAFGRPLYDRLMDRTTVDPDSGCMVWRGVAGGQGQYGQITTGSTKDGTRRKKYIHRVAWELAHGPIPPGLEIDHVKDRGCVSNRCWNVLHLETVPHQVNVDRRDAWYGCQNQYGTYERKT